MEVSKPDAVKRKTVVVALPAEQDGGVIVVRLGAVPKLALVQIMDGIPSPGVDVPTEKRWEQIKETVKASDSPERRLAALCILEPEFSFESREEGKAFWDDLLPENQAFVISQGLEVSGWKGAAPAGAKSFPEGGAGG